MSYSSLKRALINTEKWGYYSIGMSREILMEMVTEGDRCFKQDGTESDIMFAATNMLAAASEGRMEHLGLMYITVGKDKTDYSQIPIFIENAAAKYSKSKLYAINTHLVHLDIKGDMHETSLLLDPEHRVIEFWDSAQDLRHRSLHIFLKNMLQNYPNLKEHFDKVQFVPKTYSKAPQHAGAACGFWSLWYFQKRMQGATLDQMIHLFESPTLVKKAKEELFPYMGIIVTVLLMCWDKVLGHDHEPLELGDMSTSREKKDTKIFHNLLHKCQNWMVEEVIDKWIELRGKLYKDKDQVLPQLKRKKQKNIN